MKDFFTSFSSYCREAQFGTLIFWAFPLCTIFFTWFLTTIGLKLFTKRKKLKTVFIANRAWIISSLISALILISLICFWWSKNFFAQHPYRLSLIISLTIAMLIPILAQFNLRSYYTQEKIKEITDQPKTINQLDATITTTKKSFGINKLYYIIPVFGFLFLLFFLYKGTNLISIVFDNSGSMRQSNAIEALSETFDNLEENNEIVLTTLNGPKYVPHATTKPTITELLQITKSFEINAGNISFFSNPLEAKNALGQIAGFECCSPICESIWKTYLYLKETKLNNNYKNKLLIIITDGVDDLTESIKVGKFFFNNQGFSEYFPPDNVFIIDYSNGSPTPFMQRFQSAGCDIYPAEDSKQAYIDALDNALQAFKNNWCLIYWTILIFSLLTVIGLIIPPKKII
jgi:hypothetical protein